MHTSGCQQRHVAFPGFVREPPSSIHLAFTIPTVTSRDPSPIFLLLLIPLAPSRTPVFLRLSQTNKRMELRETGREDAGFQGLVIRPVVHRDYVTAHREPGA